MEEIRKTTRFTKQYKNDLTTYKITSIKNGLVEYCQDKPNHKKGEACYTLKYFIELIKNDKIKIGRKFRGLINGEEFEIIDITKGLKAPTQNSPTQKNTVYIYIKDSKGRTSYTNAENFKRLQIEPSKGGK